MKLIKPTLLDISKMQELVAPEVKNGIILYRDEDEMARTIRSYTAIVDADELIGFAALHIHSIKLAEVRSLIVKEGYRGKGVGAQLINALEIEGKMLGVKQILTLTYQKDFFEKLGFVEIAKEQIPEQKIWADCIKCKHFPICNEISLIKTIKVYFF